MSRFMFFVYPEGGHLRPALAMARTAAAAGHEVVLCSIPDAESDVRDAGFAFLPVWSELFPRGSLDALKGRVRVAQIRKHIRRLKTFITTAGGPSVERALRRIDPHVCFVDSPLFVIQLIIQHLGIPVAIFHVTLPWDEDDGVPPLNSTASVARGTGPSIRRLGARTRRRLGQWGTALLDPADLSIALPRRALRAARAWGVPTERLCRSAHPIHIIRTPEIILCPAAFDFPRPIPAHRRYVGAPVALDSGIDTVSFPFERLEGFRHVVYCAFGTRTDLYGHMPDIHRALVAAIQSRSDTHAVIVSGEGAAIGSSDPRLTFVARAPQPAVLARATAFVTHAGLGSVKEGILAGVPLIAIPMVNDQFGNAARIEFHRLGVQLNARRVTADRLGAALRTVESAEDIHAGIRRMRCQFVAAADEQPLLQAMEELAVQG